MKFLPLFWILCFVFLGILPVYAGSGRILPGMRGHYVFDYKKKNAGYQNSGAAASTASRKINQKSEAPASEAFGKLPANPSQEISEKSGLSYFVIGGGGFAILILGGLAAFLWRKKKMEEEEEW